MSWLTAALRSSVGKKCVMGVTGLFLCGFLVIHLAGNLLLYRGAEFYDDYAHALHANPVLLAIAEVFLYAGFIVHIYLAVTTNRENQAARSNPYAYKRTKRADRTLNIVGWTPDTTMFVTGAVVFGFLLIHLNDFSWTLFGGEAVAGKEPFAKAAYLLRNPVRAAIYAVGSLFLGVHVSHGLQSAFQSLGINHPRYKRTLRRLSIVFAYIITIGFASFSLWGLSQSAERTESSATEAAEVAPAEPPELRDR